MSPPKLYTWKGSGNSYKVRLLAGLLNIKLEEVEIDYLTSEQHSPEYLAINPRGQIPALVDRDKTFTDSAAILVYLAGHYHSSISSTSTSTSPSYWSNDVIEQATIVDWLAFAAGFVQPGIARARVLVVFGLKPSPTSSSSTDPEQQKREEAAKFDEALAAATATAHKSLQILQKRFAGQEWVALSSRPTIADVAIFAYVGLAHMGKIPLDAYPDVVKWMKRIESLPGFVPVPSWRNP